MGQYVHFDSWLGSIAHSSPDEGQYWRGLQMCFEPGLCLVCDLSVLSVAWSLLPRLLHLLPPPHTSFLSPPLLPPNPGLPLVSSPLPPAAPPPSNSSSSSSSSSHGDEGAQVAVGRLWHHAAPPPPCHAALTMELSVATEPWNQTEKR